MYETLQAGDVVLGKYRVEHVLGKGGMGIVVAARHVQLGELFAIKLLLSAGMAHHEAIERFLREARASARLKGEHVARVQDVGNLENGAPFMIMEHLDGEDLRSVLKKNGPLPVEDVALYLYQACEAVAEAHGHRIIHRDLKPANLFLTRRANGSPCVKVLDFGISKELDPANDLGSDLTKTGAFLGSPRYMAPEQMRASKSADLRSDIWSIGVIMYELVTGKVPFNADSVMELVSEVLTTEPIAPSEARPGIPTEFDAVVLRCLAKNPRDRFQTVRDLMAALRPFITADLVTTGTRNIVVPPAEPPKPKPAAPVKTMQLPVMDFPPEPAVVAPPAVVPPPNLVPKPEYISPPNFGASPDPVPRPELISSPGGPFVPAAGKNDLPADANPPSRTMALWAGSPEEQALHADITGPPRPEKPSSAWAPTPPDASAKVTETGGAWGDTTKSTSPERSKAPLVVGVIFATCLLLGVVAFVVSRSGVPQKVTPVAITTATEQPAATQALPTAEANTTTPPNTATPPTSATESAAPTEATAAPPGSIVQPFPTNVAKQPPGTKTPSTKTTSTSGNPSDLTLY